MIINFWLNKFIGLSGKLKLEFESLKINYLNYPLENSTSYYQSKKSLKTCLENIEESNVGFLSYEA